MNNFFLTWWCITLCMQFQMHPCLESTNEVNDTDDRAWFSAVDLQNYYVSYFQDRGYDPDINDIDDYTSFYAHLVHDKKASFKIRLHPQRCCGTTGTGGAAGLAGRSGTLVFKRTSEPYVNNKAESMPKFLANNESMGTMEKDSKTCKTLALNVRIDTVLKKLVFPFLPLRHSITSQFTILSHTDSSRCAAEYVKTKETRSLESTTVAVNNVSPSLRYKRSLLENVKNESLTTIIQKANETIDKINNDEYSLDAIISEACELEKYYFELKKLVNLTSMYQRLSDRIEGLDSTGRNEDEKIALTRLKSILWLKLSDLQEDYNLIVNVEAYSELAARRIKTRNERVLSNLNISEVNLRNNLTQLQFGVNGNYVLDVYYHVINGFQFTFFPFAVDYLEMYHLPTSFTAYENLNAISSATINKLNTLNQTIEAINSNLININSVDENAFYTWNNSDVRDKIRRLFAGEKITLLADVKQSENQFNAIKFNEIKFVFRSSERNKKLNNILKSFSIQLKHTGTSAFRCNNNFYELTSDPMLIWFHIERDRFQVPVHRNGVYMKLRDNRPMLSPYTLWEIQLSEVFEDEGNFNKLQPFVELVDIELHGTGQYIRENAPICENGNLAKLYSVVKK